MPGGGDARDRAAGDRWCQQYVSSTDVYFEPPLRVDDQRMVLRQGIALCGPSSSRATPMGYSASIRVPGKDPCQPSFSRPA
jgi:hypothetical protein